MPIGRGTGAIGAVAGLGLLVAACTQGSSSTGAATREVGALVPRGFLGVCYLLRVADEDISEQCENRAQFRSDEGGAIAVSFFARGGTELHVIGLEMGRNAGGNLVAQVGSVLVAGHPRADARVIQAEGECEYALPSLGPGSFYCDVMAGGSSFSAFFVARREF